MNAEQIFRMICRQLGNYQIASVASLSGVSQGTLYNWIEGKTRRPQLRAAGGGRAGRGH